VIYWITTVVNASLLELLDHKVIVTVNIGGVDEVVVDITL